MFYLKDFEPNISLTRTEFKEDISGIDYYPVNNDLLVFKCGFDYNYDEESLDAMINELNTRFGGTLSEELETHFVPLGVNFKDISVLFFHKEKFLAKNCFPIDDKGCTFILIVCERKGNDIYAYKPDFSAVNVDGIGISRVPLAIELVKLKKEKGFFQKIFGSKDTDDYTEIQFVYDSDRGYRDGDIYYTIEGLESAVDGELVKIPITKKALGTSDKCICINCASDQIRFGNKKRVNMVVKE